MVDISLNAGTTRLSIGSEPACAGSKALAEIFRSSVSADVSRGSTSRTTAISTGHARSTASRSTAGDADGFAAAACRH